MSNISIACFFIAVIFLAIGAVAWGQSADDKGNSTVEKPVTNIPKEKPTPKPTETDIVIVDNTPAVTPEETVTEKTVDLTGQYNEQEAARGKSVDRSSDSISISDSVSTTSSQDTIEPPKEEVKQTKRSTWNAIITVGGCVLGEQGEYKMTASEGKPIYIKEVVVKPDGTVCLEGMEGKRVKLFAQLID